MMLTRPARGASVVHAREGWGKDTPNMAGVIAEDRESFWGFGDGGMRAHIIALPFYFLIGVVLLVVGLADHHAAPVVTGVVICAFLAPILFSVFRPALVIAEGALRVPRLFSSSWVLALADVSGLGLMWRLQPYSPGWRLVVWDAEGKPRELRQFGISPKIRTRPGLAPGVKRDLTVPLADENIDRLAASKPGRVAARLYAAVIAVQGPHGPLATHAREKAIEYDARARLSPRAWWSPDGSMGRAKGMPPADPTKLVDPSYYKG